MAEEYDVQFNETEWLGKFCWHEAVRWADQNPAPMEKVHEYIAKNFPCEPPCDSFGVCNNCCDAKLIRVGSQLEQTPPPLSQEERDWIALQKRTINSPCPDADRHRLISLIERLSTPQGEK